MAANIELLRKLVRGQTVQIGQNVTNLIGPVPPEGAPLEAVQAARWLLLELPGTALLPLDDIYAGLAMLEERVTIELVAVNGIVSAFAPQPTLFVLRGQVNLPDALFIPVELVLGSPTSEFAAYVDDVPVRRGLGETAFGLSVPAGRHVIEFVMASTSFAAAFPPGLLVSPARDALTAPIWESLTTGYADVVAGTSANYLGWFGTAKVGGWSVLRRELVALGQIISMSNPGQNGEFSIVIVGNYETELVANTSASAGFELMGTVVDAAYDGTATLTYLAVLYTGLTDVRLRLSPTRSATNPYWLGRAISAGEFREVQRVQRAGVQSVVRWTDTAVTTGVEYEYVLQSYGIFDPGQLSPRSEVRTIVAGDLEPPASIILDPSYPQVVNYRVTALYQTPVTEDYAGVRVVYLDNLASGTSPGGNTTTTMVLAAAPATSAVGYTLLITGGLGVGQVRNVTVSAGATMTVGEVWTTVPDATSTYSVYRIYDVVTDYGVPNTDDQVSFNALRDSLDAVRYGNYYFCTFDLAGNTQPLSTAVVWNYTIADDNFLGANQPPVVGIQQLTYEVQDGTPALGIYTDTLNYAVIALTASDPVDGTTGVTIQYRTRLIETGTAGTPSSTTNLFDGTKTWVPNQWLNYLLQVNGEERLCTASSANTISVTTPFTTTPTGAYELGWVAALPAAAGTGTIDDPHGTRSRWVAVSKKENENWIQVRAEDQEGLRSSVLSYTPDYDNTPEISSLNVRIDPVTDVVYVTGAVDDDCRSFQWWLVPASSAEPTDVAPWIGATIAGTEFSDLSQQKSFDFSFELPDGARKVLYLRPWSEPNAAGLQGVDVERDLVRTPRTIVVFENRNELGQVTVSAVRATFLVTPTIDKVSPPADRSSTGLNTAYTLNDTGVSWSVVGGVGVYSYFEAEFRVYYVRIMSGFGAGQIRQIVTHTPTTLTIDTPWTTIPDASSVYQILEGATLWRKIRLDGTDLPFVPTIGVEYIPREADDIIIEYFSRVSGAPPEPRQRARIDPDTLAEIEDFNVVEDPAGIATVTLVGVDDDVRRWHLYAKRGSIPTMTGANALSDPLDAQYQRVDVSVFVTKEANFSVSAGVWHFIVVPINSYGEEGQRRYKSLSITGITAPPPSSAALSNVTVIPWDNGGITYHRISWNHTSAALAPGYTVRVTGAVGSGVLASEVVVASRSPGLDVDGDWNNANDTDTASLQGSVLHFIPGGLTRIAVTPGVTPVIGSYTVELLNGVAVVGTYTATVYTAFSSSVPTLTGTLTVAINESGSCAVGPPPGYPQKLTHVDRVMSHLLTWPAVTGDASAYYLYLTRVVKSNPSSAATDAEFDANGFGAMPLSWTTRWAYDSPRVQWFSAITLLNRIPRDYYFRLSVHRRSDGARMNSLYGSSLNIISGECL